MIIYIVNQYILMKQALSGPEVDKLLKEMGIEHTIYMLQPAPVPGS